ncbi:hypothetical protein DEO23_14000 [Brachybacterium endophyticum]|uniref:Uncharacterized protein n=1 Tax=Brachybacterium endophyticum TaxID=2182385 RepID=A0A2U2RH44_9MICO|nr:hypothetical protein [Brachybacterium endophyticum]PWH05189.1 hypothetical protein DEO23_14000 [Brachybacterium endophyticum]
MQRGLPSGHTLRGSVTTTLGGRTVDPSAVSIDREYADGLPGGGSFTAASGEVTYTPGADVVSQVSTPWAPTPGVPSPEDTVSLSLNAGVGPVPVLPQGRVADASGALSSRDVTVGFTDLYRSLDQSISWDAMASRMVAEGDGGYWRNPGLFGVSVVDRIFRHCGWYATPYRIPGTIVSAPMQGSAWPEAGKLDRAERLSVPGAAPGWITSPWGMQARDATLTYTPIAQRAISDNGLEITTMLPPDSGTARIVCWFAGRRVQLVWSDVQVFVSVEQPVGSFANVVTLSRTAIGTDEAITARVTRRAAGRVVVEIRTNRGTTSGTGETALTDGVMTSNLETVSVYGEGRIGAFQVSFPSVPFSIQGWRPSAVIHARAGIPNRLQVLPPAEGENCADMLEQLATAEYATYWIDETGVLQWWDLDRLAARGSVATLTTADHVTAMKWSNSLASVYSRVVVKWKTTALSVSFKERIDLWQGNGETISPGDTLEDFITAPDNEVWLMPDLAFTRAGSVGYSFDFNHAIGSFFGGVVPGEGDTPDYWSSTAGVLGFTIQKITDAAFKTTTTWNGTATVVARTLDSEAESALWRIRRSFNLPILRGRMKYILNDAATTSTQSGPAGTQEMTVDVGRWIQYEDEAQNLADRLAGVVTTPSPELSDVSIVPAPGLQLGDKITISDPLISRLTYQGVIYADSRSISTSGSGLDMTHTIRFRPTAVSRNGGATWAEWASTVRPDTWKQWAADQGGTWNQWGADPLGAED